MATTRRIPRHYAGHYPAHYDGYFQPQKQNGGVLGSLAWLVIIAAAVLLIISVLRPDLLGRVPIEQAPPTARPVVQPQAPVQGVPQVQAPEQPAPQAVEQAPAAPAQAIPTAAVAVPQPTAVVIPQAAPIRVAPGSDTRPTVAPTIAVTAPMVAGKDFAAPSATCVETQRNGATVHFAQIQDMTPAEMSSVADYLRTGMIAGEAGPCAN